MNENIEVTIKVIKHGRNDYFGGTHPDTVQQVILSKPFDYPFKEDVEIVLKNALNSLDIDYSKGFLDKANLRLMCNRCLKEMASGKDYAKMVYGEEDE